MSGSEEKELSTSEAAIRLRRARLFMQFAMVILAMLVGLGGAFHFVEDREGFVSQDSGNVWGRITGAFWPTHRVELPRRMRNTGWMSDGLLRQNAERLAARKESQSGGSLPRSSSELRTPGEGTTSPD